MTIAGGRYFGAVAAFSGLPDITRFSGPSPFAETRDV
jgi:hypothetical protein